MMRCQLWILALGGALAVTAQSGWPAGVTVVASRPNDTVTISGDLAAGQPLTDLSWAASSSNACFPATQNAKFRGPHVFFATTIPPRSVMTVTVRPIGTPADLSIYGYMNGSQDFSLVPRLPRCITCEADHRWDRPVRGKTQTHERKMEFRNPTPNTYNILVGVTTPQGQPPSQFQLAIKTDS
jgi:hypothetical protein